jgi:hypothetical protein
MRILPAALFFLLLSPFLAAADEIRSDGMVIKFETNYRNLAQETAEILSRASKTISSKTGLALSREIAVLLASSDADFRSEYRKVTGEEPQEQILAVAFPQLNRILIRRTSLTAIGTGNLPETLAHELLHIFVSQFEGARSVHIPLWLNEAAAQWVSGRAVTELERQYLANSASSGILLPLKELEVRFPSAPQQMNLAYLESYEFLRYLLKTRGEESLPRLFAASAKMGGFASAFAKVFGKPVEELEKEWTEQIARTHSFWSQFWRQVTIWHLLTLLALAAFVRYIIRTRRLKRKLEEEESSNSSGWSEPNQSDNEHTAN